MTPSRPETHFIVLPGGGYASHAENEAEPIVDWLDRLGIAASVLRYPLHARHPLPLEAVRFEVRRLRETGVGRVGVIGFSDGGHLVGQVALSDALASSARSTDMRSRAPATGTPRSAGITLAAVRADTWEVLQIRNRKGEANTQRGIARFIDELIARVRRAGHTGKVIIRADTGFENDKLFEELAKRGIEFQVGVKLSKTIRVLVEQILETAWVTVTDYPDGGQAQVAETELKGFRLIVRRTRLIGAQAELFPDWRHHCFATNRTPPLLVADTDHRDHASIELVIRDLVDQALRHFPSGSMHANSAWTVIAALAHNLGRWTTQIGLPNAPVQTARTRRDQLLAVPARLTRSGRQWTLRMPARWPWQQQFNTILDKIRALPALT
ncbi:MAG TPA: transposase [Solirubrobacteraceae bacterium]|jgi:hypothetical protein